ncbi:c-binding -like isoform X1, partial [Paramuricea clavata]
RAGSEQARYLINNKLNYNLHPFTVRHFTGNINECLENTHDCDKNATCTNAEGSFNCSCKNGYRGNGTSCKDINECLENRHDCDKNATCTNAEGSFNCSCKNGYRGNGTSCKDRNECLENSHDCDVNAICTNTEGSFNCSCKNGYRGNGTSCKGIGFPYLHEAVRPSRLTWDLKRHFILIVTGREVLSKKDKNNKVKDALRNLRSGKIHNFRSKCGAFSHVKKSLKYSGMLYLHENQTSNNIIGEKVGKRFHKKRTESISNISIFLIYELEYYGMKDNDIFHTSRNLHHDLEEELIIPRSFVVLLRRLLLALYWNNLFSSLAPLVLPFPGLGTTRCLEGHKFVGLIIPALIVIYKMFFKSLVGDNDLDTISSANIDTAYWKRLRFMEFHKCTVQIPSRLTTENAEKSW